MRKVSFQEAARSDLFGIYGYIAEQSGSDRAVAYLDRIERLCAGLQEFPEKGTPRNDLVPGLRTLALDRRVLVAYRIQDDDVMILRVLYAGQDFTVEAVPQ